MKKNKSKTMSNYLFYDSKPDTEKQNITENLVSEEELKNIVLYNDDVNTFDFVIDSLIKICNHDVIQAVQCTYLAHYVGKCAVKRGTYDELRPMCEALLERGLTATIE